MNHFMTFYKLLINHRITCSILPSHDYMLYLNAITLPVFLCNITWLTDIFQIEKMYIFSLSNFQEKKSRGVVITGFVDVGSVCVQILWCIKQTSDCIRLQCSYFKLFHSNCLEQNWTGYNLIQVHCFDCVFLGLTLVLVMIGSEM